MWDEPDLLNAVASLIFAAAFLLAGYGALHYVVRLPQFPLREVRIGSAPVHVTREQIEDVVRREFTGNFFTLDLAAARAAFEKLPWVRAASVRRQWPDRLDVMLEEHVPLARWEGAALVNVQGELFTAAYNGKLPLFSGPPGSAKEIAIQYGYFKRRLADIQQAPVEVRVSPRRAWQLRLDNGLVIELGREQIEARLDRLVAVYDRTIGRLQRRIDYVDLRYVNGFAVRAPEALPARPQKRGARTAHARFNARAAA